LIDAQCYMICNGFTAGYVREQNPRLGDKDYKIDPLKNNFSHIHDALQYALVTEIYPKVKEPRQDIADEESMIAEFPPRMTAWGTGARNKVIPRGKDGEPLEPAYSVPRAAAATGWDPRAIGGRRR
jgi:hypothetical protein